MAVRALIVAIEEYAQVTGGALAATLPGTLQAGLDVESWLRARGGPPPEILFCSAPQRPGGRGAARADVLQALLDLKQAGQNTTEELYVFFSGHGFSFAQPVQGRTDFLVSADFTSLALSAHCCLTLNGIVGWLRDHLGPGRHYYFIDACRNVLNAQQVAPPDLGLPIDLGASGEASTFVLQSTTEGATAAVGSAFPAALLAGLRGKGTAKTYDDTLADAMVVRYNSLRQYLKAQLPAQPVTSRVAGQEGEEVVLATLTPMPMSTCTIRIEEAAAGDSGVVFLSRRGIPLPPEPLRVPQQTLRLQPDTYHVAVQVQGATVAPSEFVRVNLFDDASVVFRRGAVSPGGGGADDADVRLRAAAPPPPPADEPEGATARRTGPAWAGNLPQESLAARFPHDDTGIDFSESLGPVHDPDLDVWLAIVGAGRILLGGPHADFSKIGPLPLHDFRDERPGASPLYVLAGLPPGRVLDVCVGHTPGAAWQAARETLPHVAEFHAATPPGPLLVSFGLGDDVPSVTVATGTMRNRATLLTLTLDEDDGLRIGQYLLPIGQLVPELPDEVRDLVRGRTSPLADVRQLAVATRTFRHRGRLQDAVPTHRLDELLVAKWIDPIGSALIGYELLRRGERLRMGPVVANMQRYFPDLPDSAALARLAGLAAARPAGVPLVLDGLRAFPDHAGWLPLPAGLLDRAGPWTTWRGAV